MPKFRIDLDDETYAHLAAVALEQKRPPHWQAEWMLMQAVREWVEKRQLTIDLDPTAIPCPEDVMSVPR